MNYAVFSESISKIINLPLPGEASQFKMAPALRLAFSEKDIEARNPKQSAVMALFYPAKDQTTRILLILRKTYKGVHSNQVGFPGGKLESDDADLLSAALRETYEEVGVLGDEVKVIKSLTRVYIPPSNFWVQPYIGMMHTTPQFKLQPEEVERIIEVPVSEVLDETTVFYETLTTSYATDIEVPAFNLNGYTVWGATAMMLSEIKELLKQIF